VSEADNLVLRAEHLLDIRRTGDALALLRKAIAAEPTHVDALCTTARAYLREGQLDDARRAAETALSLEPANGYAAYLRAAVLLTAGSPDALAAAEFAVRLDPEFWPSYGTLAGALVKHGYLAQALAVAREGVALAPHDPAAHTMLGGIADDAKERKAAEAAYREALRLQPDYTAARVGLAALQFSRWRVRTAAGHLIAAAANDPVAAAVAGGLRTLITFGMVISLFGVALSAVVALVALIAGSFTHTGLVWAQVLCAVMAVLLLGGLIFLATRIPRSARPLLRSMLRANKNRFVPIFAGLATVLLLAGFAVTGQKPVLALLVLIAFPAFLMADQVGDNPNEEKPGPKTADDILF
jgi:tetratricopeptide (TPR) repeat protein